MKVIAPFMSCVVNLPLTPEDHDEFQQAVNDGYVEIYVVTPTGIIKHHKLRGENRYLRLKVDSIPNTPLLSMNQEINFLPAGKVPHELLRQIEGFFRKVMEVKKNELEAMIWVLWSPERGYYLHVPDQTISKASVRYDWDSVPQGSSIIVDIHSHNTMNAFFSGTDNNDDVNGIRFSGVFGQLHKPEPMTVWRFNYRDRKYEAKLEDIFELPQHESVEIPDEWLTNVKTVSYAGTGYLGPGSGHRSGSGAHMDAIDRYMGRGMGSHLRGRLDKAGGKVGDDDDKDPPVGHGKGEPSSKKAVSAHGNQVLHVSATEEEHASNDMHSSFMADFWGLSQEQMAQVGMDTAEERALAAAERSIATNALGLGNQEEDEDGLFGLVDSIVNHDRYDELIINHGSKVATSFCGCSELMVDLDGHDPLLHELIGDMVGLMEGSERAKALRNIWDTLPESEKEKIQSNGF